jgi:hypothetical protein
VVLAVATAHSLKERLLTEHIQGMELDVASEEEEREDLMHSESQEHRICL